MHFQFKILNRFHLLIFVMLFIAFTFLTAISLNGGLDQGPDHRRMLIKTTALTVTGPMTGAIARDFQSCCFNFSLAILPYSGAALLLGFFIQVISFSHESKIWGFKYIAWALGWLLWFGGGILSFAHALE
jgi:hypothetical protein